MPIRQLDEGASELVEELPRDLVLAGVEADAAQELIEQANELLSAGETETAMDLYSKAYMINDREPHTIFQVASYHVQLAQGSVDRLRGWGYAEGN